jgi:hypothetical protein
MGFMSMILGGLGYLKWIFLKFDGSDVRIWLDKCFAYFQLYLVPHDFRVTIASLLMLDKTSHWFQTYKHSLGVHTWEHFVVNTHRVKTIEPLNLRQIGSVEDYKNQFDKLVYHILLYDNSISEIMRVSQFLLGLKDELRHYVEMHLPTLVSQAATLATVQEHLNEKQKPQHRRFPAPELDNKSTVSTPVLLKARQLKEYRRINNPCFKCGEKYTPTHTCITPTATLNMIVNSSADGGSGSFFQRRS